MCYNIRYMVEKSKIPVVKLRDIPVGNRCLLLPDHKNGVDPLRQGIMPTVTRSELHEKNGQGYMLTKVYGIKTSFSANTAAIDMGKKLN